MTPQYRLFFELQTEPFGADIAPENILVTDSVIALEQRVHYAMRTGAVAGGRGRQAAAVALVPGGGALGG